MKPFRFRAQVAIDLRRREYDEARRVLARTLVDRQAAAEVLAETSARLAAGRADCGREMAATTDTGRWAWHRSWLVRLERERAASAAEVEAREREVARATAASLEARRRLQALERVRDNARQAWERAAAAEERKEIDMLATLRHVAAARDSAQRSRP